MRTTLTTSIDGQLKEEVMKELRRNNQSVSEVLTECFKNILKNKEELPQI